MYNTNYTKEHKYKSLEIFKCISVKVRYFLNIIKIHESQINRRWNRHVKKDLGITVDFYAFKHANSTEVVDEYGFATSAAINSHKDESMVRKLYDVKRDEREHEKIKDVKNWF